MQREVRLTLLTFLYIPHASNKCWQTGDMRSLAPVSLLAAVLSSCAWGAAVFDIAASVAGNLGGWDKELSTVK